MSDENGDTRYSLFVQKMPKVELHAHLNGSLSTETMKKLLTLKEKKQGINNDTRRSLFKYSSDLSECFEIFNIIHSITDSPESIFMATCDVIKEFYEDGIFYLELRSTPREIENCMSRNSYVETVLAAIEKTLQESCPDMLVKLILSIDRRNSKYAAEETLRIAEEKFRSTSIVVGLDLSGDPTKGDINLVMPVLEYAKTIGLKLLLHVSEVPGCHEEIEHLLRLNPYRIGHGTFLHPNRGGSIPNFTYLKENKIPLEICLTSNIVSKTVSSYPDHHFQYFKEINHPCVICTDDKGVFHTSLSEEYLLAQKHFSLTEADLWNLSYESIDFICGTNNEKRFLKELWNEKKKCIFL